MVHAARHTGVVPDDAEVVAPLAHRRHAEDDEVGPVGDDRVLHVAVPERVPVPADVALGIGGGDRDVVDATERGAARDVALGPVRERRHELGGSLVALHLPEHLVEVPARAPVTVGRPVPDRALVPAFAAPRCLDAGDRRLELLGALGAPGDMAEPRGFALGQLERVVEEVAPPAQVGGLAGAPRALKAEHLRVEAE